MMLSQLLLILGGYGLLQLLAADQRVRFLPWLPFYWGCASVMLYLLGSFFVATDLLLGRWHWAIIAMCLGLLGLALWRRQRVSDNGTLVATAAIRWRWFHYVLMALGASKIALVIFVSVHNPVIDSDATLYNNYVAMAKKIGNGLSRDASLAQDPEHETRLKSSLGPSILSAYPRLLIDRWHNHAVSIPWLFCYLSILGLAFFFSNRISKHFTVSLAITYLVSALPLIVNHTIRPGFNDLLVCYFLMMAFAAAAIFIKNGGFGNYKSQSRLEPLLMFIGALGACLSKPEGAMWVIWLAMILFSYALNFYKKIAWPKIIGGQIILAILILIAWYTFGGALIASYGGRASQLAPATAFDPSSWEMTINFLFQWGSFNLLWWIGIVAAGLVFFYADNHQRVFVFYLVAMMAVLIFFINLTQNQVFTIQGTTPGRFLLHLIFIPLLAMAFAVNAMQNKKALDYH